VLFTVPRYTAEIRLRRCCSASPIERRQRHVADLAFDSRARTRSGAGTASGVTQEVLYRACRAGVFRPIPQQARLRPVELLICGGAPLPSEARRSGRCSRQRRRDVRADRDRRLIICASAARFAPGARHGARGLGGQAPGDGEVLSGASTCLNAIGQRRGHRRDQGQSTASWYRR